MNDDSVRVYYFTGTGNARKVARWIQETATDKKVECEVHDITSCGDQISLRPDPHARLAFVSPIHGFNYPRAMLSFLFHFPKGTNDVILLNTRAGMRFFRWPTPGLTGVAFLLASLILRLKGYRIRGALPVDLPSNWISVHPGLRESTIQFLNEKMEKRVKPFAEAALAGKRCHPFFYEMLPNLLLAPIAVLYFLFGRFALAKSYVASSNCNGCGACIANCPVKAISLVDSRPFWGYRCESCMRCMGLCPRRAVEVAHGSYFVGILLLNLVVLPLVYSGIGLFLFPQQVGWVKFLLDSLFFVVFIGLWYRFVHALMRFRFVERLVVWTALTNYRFWGRRYSTR